MKLAPKCSPDFGARSLTQVLRWPFHIILNSCGMEPHTNFNSKRSLGRVTKSKSNTKYGDAEATPPIFKSAAQSARKQIQIPTYYSSIVVTSQRRITNGIARSKSQKMFTLNKKQLELLHQTAVQLTPTVIARKTHS
jgi:hypothetical protein